MTSNMMWHDMDPYDWLFKFYNFYIVPLVGIITLELKCIIATEFIYKGMQF